MEKASKTMLKEIRELLQDKKARDEKNSFVAEGLKIVRDMLAKGTKIKSIFATNDFLSGNENILIEAQEKNIPVFAVSAKELDKISGLQNSQEILVIAEKPVYLKNILYDNDACLAVLCDGIQDPGNLGNVIRTAAAFGANAVLITGETVDAFNPKVVRASSGMVVDIPIMFLSKEEIVELKKNGFIMFAGQLDTENGKRLEEIENVPAKTIVVFGSEGRGVSKEILKLSDEFFYIPISEKVESLNVSSAAAIALYWLMNSK